MQFDPRQMREDALPKKGSTISQCCILAKKLQRVEMKCLFLK